ncbi:MAG: MotA/TolQ/ExbB proton channel family protein [Pseudomonadota bacterium]
MAQALASATHTSDSQATTGNKIKSIASAIRDPLRSLLLLRFLLLNLFAFALLGVAWSQDYVAKVTTADKTYLSVVIFAVFLVGLIISARKIWQTNQEIDAINSSAGIHSPSIAHLITHIRDAKAETRANLSSSMRMRVAHRISVVRHLANTLVLLGLIGTVLGFIIALSGVNPDTVADVNAIAPMVSTLISGMSTALYTTLVGSILNVWLMANYQILSSGTVHLIGSLQEAVEKHA